MTILIEAIGWIAAALIFLVAFGSGLIRALGPAGVSLGLTVGLTFLVEIGVHHHGGSTLERAERRSSAFATMSQG